MRNVRREQWEHGAGQTDRHGHTLLLPPSSGPGGSHGVPAPRRAHPAAPWSGGLAAAIPPSPRTREFAIETEKPRRETRILLPSKRGRRNGASHSPKAELSFPMLHRDAQGPAPHRSPAPALHSRLPEKEEEEEEGSPVATPCTWASMSVPHRVDCRSGSTMVSRSGDSM